MTVAEWFDCGSWDIIQCYLFVLLVGAQRFRTQTKDNTQNPVWNEVFEVIVPVVIYPDH